MRWVELELIRNHANVQLLGYLGFVRVEATTEGDRAVVTLTPKLAGDPFVKGQGRSHLSVLNSLIHDLLGDCPKCGDPHTKDALIEGYCSLLLVDTGDREPCYARACDHASIRSATNYNDDDWHESLDPSLAALEEATRSLITGDEL